VAGLLNKNKDEQGPDQTALLTAYMDWQAAVMQALICAGHNLPDMPDIIHQASAFAPKDEEERRENTIWLRWHANHIQLTSALEALDLSASPKDSEAIAQIMALYSTCLHDLRYLEKAKLFEERGFDVLTGLRNPDFMFEDFRAELDRVGREGQSFSIAVVIVDNFHKAGVSDDDPQVRECLRLIADLLSGSVRSFDHVYRLSTYQFVVSLKQTDIGGGVKAMHRVAALLKLNGRMVALEGEDEKPLSFSACVSEPFPEDNIDDLINNMQYDLERHIKGPSNIIEYVEASKLERHVMEKQQKQTEKA